MNRTSRGGPVRGRSSSSMSTRGRGRGARSDYSTVALDYEAVPSPVPGSPSPSSNVATSSTSRAPSYKAHRGSDSTPRRGRTAVGRPSHFSASASPASTPGTATPAHHGIGSSSLLATGTRDTSGGFLRPVSFVKANISLASTIDQSGPGETPSPAASLSDGAFPSSSERNVTSDATSDATSDEAGSSAKASVSILSHAFATSALLPDANANAEGAMGEIYEEAAVNALSQQSEGHGRTAAVDSFSQSRSPVVCPDSPAAKDIPDDQLFYVDTARMDDSQSLNYPLEFPQIVSASFQPDEDDDIPSDTEEVYRPPQRTVDEGIGIEAKSAASRRSYAIVVDESTTTYVAAPVPPQLSADALELVADATRSSTKLNKTSNMSRMAQKKKAKREARERKKLRKKGQMTTRLFEEMDLASDNDGQQAFETSLDRDLPLETGFPTTVKGKKKPARSSAVDEALQDYISNILDGGDPFDSDAKLSFLRTTEFEHSISDNIPNFDDSLDEDLSSEADENEAQFLAEDGSPSSSRASETQNANSPRPNKPRTNGSTSTVDLSEEEQTMGGGDSSSSVDSDEDEISEDIMAFEEHIMDGESFSNKTARRLHSIPSANSAHFDFDAFDDSLQKQWQNDRAKKALKRQERLLKRLEAQPTKLNRKKAKRAGISDVSSMLADGRPDLSGEPDFAQINQSIRLFVENTARAELALPPMEKKLRFAVHMLADAYSLKSKSRGTGQNRHNVLYRTMHTRLAGANTYKVQRYLAGTASMNIRIQSHGKTEFKSQSRTTSAPRNNEGSLVGEGADRIASDNIGHQMLAKMGWAAGEQIGRGGGLAEPIVAVVKTNKAGLGSGFIRYSRVNQDE